jgi:1-phosphofructokinase
MDAPTGKAGALPRVAIFFSHPLLTVTIETSNADRDDVHLHPGGQGVWVARMAAELGAHPIVCGFTGGETGAVVDSLLAGLPGECRLVTTSGSSGCYVVDRRRGERELISQTLAQAPSRHELDDLFSVTCAAALDAEVLVVCNPYPPDSLPLDTFSSLVSDCRQNGTPVLVDLSSPRLDHALEGEPDLVKVNDWELAEFVAGPVSTPAELHAAVERLLRAGARSVVVTRGGNAAFAFSGEGAWEITPPRFERGSREGCGDSMMGAMAAARARGMAFEDSIALGAAAGAANFLRHGLGTGSRAVVEDLVRRVEMRRLDRP